MMPWLLLADASWSGPLAGTSPASTTSVGTPPLPPIDASFNLSLLGPLALVSLLLIVALLVLRYVRLAKSPSQAGLLSVVAQASLSPQHTLYLVQAAGRYLLLGGAPGGLALLSEVPANRIADSTPQRTGGAPLGTPYPPASDDDELADSDDDLPALGGPSHRVSRAGQAAGDFRAMSSLPATPLPAGLPSWDAALLSYAPLLLLAGVLLLAIVKAGVVMTLLRHALGGVPPAPLAALLAVLLSAFAMAPLAERLHGAMSTGAAAPGANQKAADPEQQLEAGLRPLRDFLVRHTPARDQQAVADLAARMRPSVALAPGAAPSLPALLLAFTLAELRTAFLVGFVLLLPFVLIDLFVASLLSGLALSGLSAQAVALPCKLLLFVACDGWQLLARGLLLAYGGPDAGGGHTMTDSALLALFERALLLSLLLALPPLLMAALAGGAVGLLQARLGIHESSPPALARLLAGFVTLVLLAPWLGRETLRFATALWTALPALGGPGGSGAAGI